MDRFLIDIIAWFTIITVIIVFMVICLGSDTES